MNSERIKRLIDTFQNALRYNNYLPRLAINCSRNIIDFEIMMIFEEFLIQQSKYPFQVSTFSFNKCKINTVTVNIFSYILQNSLHLSAKLSLNLAKNEIDNIGFNSLIKGVLQSRSHIADLNISLNSNLINAAELPVLEELEKASETGNALLKIDMDLSNNQIKTEGATQLMLLSQYFPPNSTLNLSSNRIGDEGAQSIAESLQMQCFKPNLTLILNNNQISIYGIQALIGALLNYPSKFTLNLCGRLNAISIQQKIEYLESDLILNLSGNDIGDKEAQIIAESLQIGYSNSSLKIILATNHIRTAGVQALVKALWQIHRKITLDLSRNKLGYTATTDLLTVLQSFKYMPKDIMIDLSHNRIRVTEVQMIENLLQKNLLPKGLIIDLSYNSFNLDKINARNLREIAHDNQVTIILSEKQRTLLLTETDIRSFKL